MHRPTEQSHEEHVEAGRKSGRTRSKASGESDPVETDSPAKKQRSINVDRDPDFAKGDDSAGNDGKNPNRVEAGKKAAETRRRKQSGASQDDDQSQSQEEDSGKSSSHGKMHRPTEQSHEEHVEAGKKGAEARWGKDSTQHSSQDNKSGSQSSSKSSGKSSSKGGDEAKSLMDKLSKDPKIQQLKEKQNAERDQEIKEGTQLLQQALKQSSKPDLALMMNPKGKNLIQVIRAEHRLVEQLGEQLTSMLKQSDNKSNDIALGMAFNIMKLLSIHAACEEMVLYPMLNEKGYQALCKHALEEHLEMKRDLLELDRLSGQLDKSEFMEKLQKCLEDTLHHVTEEEESLLPLCESLLSQAEMDQLLTQFLEGHMKSPTRPHLDAAAEPPSNLKENPILAKTDMQMDIDEGRFEVPAAM